MSVKLQQASTTENFCFPNRKLIVSIYFRELSIKILFQFPTAIDSSTDAFVCLSYVTGMVDFVLRLIRGWMAGGAARRQAVSSFPVYAFEKSVDPSYQWTPALAFPLSAGFGHFIAFGRII